MILTTITGSAAVSALLPGLTTQGRLIALRVDKDTLEVMRGCLVGGERIVQGSRAGTPFESERP